MNAAELEEQILTAAQEEFARGGFHKTVVSDIADRAGVGKGTVYRHFGCKSELFGELVQKGTRDLHSQIKKTIQPDRSPKQQLVDILHVHFDLYEEARELLEIIVNEGLQRTGELQDTLISEWQAYSDTIARVFERGIEEGVFRERNPGKLARLFHGWIWSVLRTTVIFDSDRSRQHPRREYAELMIELFLHGIMEPRTSGHSGQNNHS